MYEKELLATWKYIIQDSGMKLVFVANSAIHDQLAAAGDELPTLERIAIIRGQAI